MDERNFFTYLTKELSDTNQEMLFLFFNGLDDQILVESKRELMILGFTVRDEIEK